MKMSPLTVCGLTVILVSTCCVLSLAQQGELYRCPQGLSGKMYAFQEKCYRFVPTEKNWNQAQNDCQVKGGNLVHIYNQPTQNFIYNKAKNTLKWDVNGMWIGSHDQRKTNHWEWVNGNPSTAGNAITWKNWGSGQPSCGILCIEHCGQMRLDDYGRWHDVQCDPRFLFSSERYRYCCMYDMGPKTTTTTTAAPTSATTTTQLPSTTTEVTSTISNTTSMAPETKATFSSRNIDGAVESDKSTFEPVAVVGSQGQGSEQIESRENNMEGGTVAGIAIGCLVALCLLLLLLLIFMRRRKQKKEDEPPSETFPNQTYTGAVTAAGPALAYVNPQCGSATYLNPTLTVRMPEKEDKLENPYSECLDNQHNACAAANDSDDDAFGHSKGIYEDIKLNMKDDLSDFDSEEEFENSRTKSPSVEYLHARQPPARQNPGPLVVPPRNLYAEDQEPVAQDNIYVPMATGNENPYNENTYNDVQ